MTRFFILLSLILLPFASLSAEEAKADPLAAFDPFIGKTFVGNLGDNTGTDVQFWEKVLGGKAVRITHSLNEGSYGGETLLYVNKDTGEIDYVYVTTAGFRTEGTMTINEDGSWSAEEEVKGHDTIKAVRSNGSRQEDGSLLQTSTYINKDGTEAPGHSFVYREDADAKIVW
jgi:hypothetical protein